MPEAYIASPPASLQLPPAPASLNPQDLECRFRVEVGGEEGTWREEVRRGGEEGRREEEGS